MKAYRKEAIIAPVFKLFEACMELLVPLIVSDIVDAGIANGDRRYILLRCLLLVCLGVAGLAFALIAQFFAAKAAVGTSAQLRSRLFHKLQSFSFTQIDSMGTSTMITRMTSDVNQVQTGVNMALRLFLRAPIIVFGAMIMAFVMDAQAGIVFVAIIPLLAIAVFAVMGASLPLYQRVQGNLDNVYLSVRENLAGARVIRAFSMEERERAEFDRRNASLEKMQKKAGRISALTNPLTYVLVNLAVIALLWVGGRRVDLGILEQGDVIALYSYLSQILVELVKLANLIVTVTKAVSCEKRIEKVLNMQGERETLLPASESKEGPRGEVRFEKVSFAYAGGGANALTDIDFTVRRGETVGILGGTGAGKSTLVNLIPRFYSATEGRVVVDGEDVAAQPVRGLRAKIGFVPQKAVLFQGTIRSNLLWGNEDATDEDLNEALRIAQAVDVAEAKGGLDGEVAQEGKNLSGGQRQRLTIARAIVKKPDILILDDSASALDYATDARLRASLREIDATVFLVSQRTASVLHADQIIVLDDGKIAGIGRHEDLIETCQVYREIYSSQFREGA